MLAPDAPAAPYAIRPAEPEDVAFLLGTWLEQYFRESPWAHRIRAREFFAGHRPIIVRTLERAQVLVACDPEDPDTIAGYLVFEKHPELGAIVDFVYVKKAMRRLGIGRALVRAAGLPEKLAGVQISHATRLWFSTKAHGPGLEEQFAATYNPYLMWR